MTTAFSVGSDALRLGTRSSALALAQSRQVADALSAKMGVSVELVKIVTSGDRSQASQEPISTEGGTGIFVSALRDALSRGEIDVAVHSYKDVPIDPVDGLTIAAVPPREDPRDVLVARRGASLSDLPSGATVGTSSPRRSAQLLALGLGLDVVPVRGNVDTRVSKVREGELDGVVLARAGLSRLGLLDAVTDIFDPLQMLPAPAQGALAVECRLDDEKCLAALAELDDPETRAAVVAERAVLAALQAGCTNPVAALAEVALGDAGPELFLRGSVTAADGTDSVRLTATGLVHEAEALGRRLAADLVAAGAVELMGSTR